MQQNIPGDRMKTEEQANGFYTKKMQYTHELTVKMIHSVIHSWHLPITEHMYVVYP